MREAPTVLVLGASGFTGSAVTRAVTRRGGIVRGFTRNAAAAADVRVNGAAEVVVGDLRDLGAVEEAARGVDGIFFIGPRFMPEEAALGRAVIDVAVRAGVPRFVLSGVYHPSIRALVNHRTKREVEDHLFQTDLEFTVLQPARFMHGLLLSSWARILREGVLADAFAADARMAYVSYGDVAEVAAIALTEDQLVRGTFELAAPGQHTLSEVARILAAVLGRPVRAERVSLADYPPAGALMANPYAADGFRRLARYYDAHGFHGGNALVLSTILGRPPATFADVAGAMWRQSQGRGTPEEDGQRA